MHKLVLSAKIKATSSIIMLEKIVINCAVRFLLCNNFTSSIEIITYKTEAT